MISKVLKPILFIVLLIVSTIFAYRILTTNTATPTDVTGLIIVLSLALVLVLSDRLSEMSASHKGVSAKFEGVNTKLTNINEDLSELRRFILGSVDDETVKTLIEISNRSLVSPENDHERDSLKFRLRTLRRASLILRDEATAKSISWVVKQDGNLSAYFIITRLGETLLKLEDDRTNDR